MSILWTDSNDAHARPLLTAHCLPQLFATTVCHNCLFTYCLFTYCCSPIVVPLLLCTRQVPGAMAYAPTRPTHVCTPKFSTTFALSDLDLIQLRSAETPGPGLYYGEKWCWTWTTVQLYLYSRSTVLTPLDLFRLLSTSFDFFRLLSTSGGSGGVPTNQAIQAGGNAPKFTSGHYPSELELTMARAAKVPGAGYVVGGGWWSLLVTTVVDDCVLLVS
jgi:hypothetical protein